ncbi:D-TA family PLP-dependent enzyme [Mucilaginibacter pallidiroseus]|uniref:D-TA family PLP-dependent enzyme n=1 Tax=Mucilaginibacter pallidiroseus TaxID=2599295 RepID=A0A563UJ65_9SPHI|nr:D-TA family PLP-dependent enzyme [Mucilaginibacter pallidiroseus]TWR31395.1 D-TA family PLP-dependent enzyme [Mucilaginibacter pallidiroseus]
MAANWFDIANTDAIDTPALVIYPERVQYNIDLLKTMIDDVARLRPHVKTHKSPQVSQLMIQAGITKFKCATIAEAEMLGQCKAPDVLLAYQPNDPKLHRFIELIKAYPDTAFSCLVDNMASAKAISKQGVANGLLIDVFIDLNVGMNRTGIAPAKAFALYQQVASLPSLTLKGLHAYDGHIHDHDYNERQLKLIGYMQQVLGLIEQIKKAGYPQPVLIAGGSPTFSILAKFPQLECSPGTFVYWDKGYQTAFEEQPFKTAALILGRVVSLPDDGKICIDIGHKSVSAENELNKRIYFLNAPDLKLIGQSEEHLVADGGRDYQFKVGDILYGLPHHICPTVALYERAIAIENGVPISEWFNTARDRKINI